MFVRPTNPVSHRLARMAFIMSCVAALIVASAGPLHRYLGLEIEPAFAIFRYGFYVAVAGAALGLATIVPTRPSGRHGQRRDARHDESHACQTMTDRVGRTNEHGVAHRSRETADTHPT